MPRTVEFESNREGPGHDLDLRALGGILKRRRRAIILPAVLAFALVGIFVNVVTPRYVAESQVLLENQETFFTRPDRTSTPSEQSAVVDPEAVGSQIQLITSRDLASRAIKDLGLKGDPEFDPTARTGALARVLILLGIGRDPTMEAVDTRILQAFQDRLTVFSPPKTRVITIQFQSRDPALAARAANTMAELYIAEQSSIKRISAKDAADALSGQIADLRVKLASADAERERYRAQTGLLAGTNNMTISGQQLADINSDLSKARTVQADAQAKASMIRDLLRAGKTADVPDVINNDLVRRVSEQRVTAQAELALESRTLLPGHPRIKELTAQVADLDSALKAAAKQAVSTLENESRISGQRVANLEAVLTQQKKAAGAANNDEVRLRSLDRIAQSYKDQLDSSTTKYQEALARETSTATPADARIIARAVEPQEPSFPKKLPFIAFGTIATLVFAIGLVIAGALLGGPVVEETGAFDEKAAHVPPRREPAARPQRAVVTPSLDADRDAVILERGLAAEPPAPLRRAAEVKAPRVETQAVLEAQPASQVSRPTPAPQSKPETWRTFFRAIKAFGLSADASRSDVLPPSIREAQSARQARSGRGVSTGVGWDGGFAPQPSSRESGTEPHAAVTDDAHSGMAIDLEALAGRIVASHVPGRGLHIVGAGLGSPLGADEALLDLGRILSGRGRSIVVDLDATPIKLSPLVAADDAEREIRARAGLSELLSGDASFAEVIHRDHASRLHFIPTGRGEADFRDFDLILDALSETYDFIILLAPAFPRSEIAKVMAPYANFVVLAASGTADATMLNRLEADLIEAGAREVLVIGRPAEARALREPHVA